MNIKDRKNHASNTDSHIGVIICFIVFGYACLRASLISISHDEALTYLIHVRSSTFEQIIFNPKGLASNSHLLNTLLIKIFTDALGASELVIRIPALLGCLLYITASYKLLKLFLKNIFFITGLILLITNPFIIDFFSCARGYSLGLGFMMWSLYFCFKRLSVSSNILKYNSLAIAAASFSVLSQIVFVNTYLAVLSFLFIGEIVSFFQRGKTPLALYCKNFSLRFLLPLSLSALDLFLIYNPLVLKKIKMSTEGFGGVNGIWQDSVLSLIQSTLRDNFYAVPLVVSAVAVFIILCIVAATAVFFLVVKNKKYSIHTSYLFSAFFLLGIITLIIKLEAVLFQLRYPVDRTGIYLIPLFLLFFLTLWNYFNQTTNLSLNKIINRIFFTICLIIILHHALCVNLKYFYLWKYDASTKEAMNLIERDTVEAKQYPGLKYSLGVNWLFEPSTNFYIFTHHISQIYLTLREGPDNYYDYYYYLPKDIDTLKKYHLKIMQTFAASTGILAKPSGENLNHLLDSFSIK